MFAITNTKLSLQIVVDTESEPHRLLGTYEGTDEDTIAYSDTSGRIHHAPQDCVRVVTVSV